MLERIDALLTPRRGSSRVAHVSNALGTVNPVADDRAHRARARACRCWSTARRRRRTCRSTCRRSTATSTCSPATRCTARPASACSTASASLLEAMPPFQGGGDMIRSVTFEKRPGTTLPYKFEAGTPDIAGAIGLGAALDYLSAIGLERDRGARARPARPTPPAALSRDSRAARSSAPRAQKAEHPVVRAGRRAPARRRHHPRSRGRRDPHRPPLRPAGDGALRRRRRPRAPRWRSTTRARRSTRWSAAARQRAARSSRERMSICSDLYQEVILDHNRSRGTSARSKARATTRKATTRCAAIGSPCIVQVEGDRDRRRGVRGLRLRDFEGVGLADDRRAQGHDRGRGAARCSSGFTGW